MVSGRSPIAEPSLIVLVLMTSPSLLWNLTSYVLTKAASTEISAVTAVSDLNSVSPESHLSNLYPSFAGASGMSVPRVPPSATVLVA